MQFFCVVYIKYDKYAHVIFRVTYDKCVHVIYIHCYKHAYKNFAFHVIYKYACNFSVFNVTNMHIFFPRSMLQMCKCIFYLM